MAKLGVEEPETDGVSEYVKRTLEELEANQPGEPKVETDELENLPDHVIYGTDSREEEAVHA